MILGVAKITLKALIQILKFYNTKPTDATKFSGHVVHTQLIVSILSNCH
jgi:hypothetical protein